MLLWREGGQKWKVALRLFYLSLTSPLPAPTQPFSYWFHCLPSDEICYCGLAGPMEIITTWQDLEMVPAWTPMLPLLSSSSSPLLCSWAEFRKATKLASCTTFLPYCSQLHLSHWEGEKRDAHKFAARLAEECWDLKSTSPKAAKIGDPCLRLSPGQFSLELILGIILFATTVFVGLSPELFLLLWKPNSHWPLIPWRNFWRTLGQNQLCSVLFWYGKLKRDKAEGG